MSSLLDPPVAIPLAQVADANETKPAALPAVAMPPVALPVMPADQRLKAVTRYTPVTWFLLAANVLLFALMAMSQQRLFYFNPHTLLRWGGGLAPRVFGSEWWRAASHMFAHADLAHLAGNMLFLLLIGPLVERLLGPVRFALVYLFAGIGAGLLGMGTEPQHVMVGASAAVSGIYGALLGCCLRGPRSIPWRLIGERAGVLLLYTVVSLLADWLDFEQHPIIHLSGFVFGFAGGLLCGHKLQPRATRWRHLRLAIVAVAFVGILGLTGSCVKSCASKALEYYGHYAAVKDRERELRGQFEDAMLQWAQNKLSSAEWKQVLERKLIPSLEQMRIACGLKLTGQDEPLEKRNFPMSEYWSLLRKTPGEPKGHDQKPLTIKEYGEFYRFLSKVRLDTWRALADELPKSHAFAARAMMDIHELDMLAAGLDDELNDDNPLYRWFELSRKRKGFE